MSPLTLKPNTHKDVYNHLTETTVTFLMDETHSSPFTKAVNRIKYNPLCRKKKQQKTGQTTKLQLWALLNPTKSVR